MKIKTKENYKMFDNLSSSEKINEFIKESYEECRASYPLPSNRSSVAVDIGANIGGFCLYAQNKFKKIYAFEPSKENYNVLTRVLDQLNINNVEVYNTAIYSQSDKTLDLKVCVPEGWLPQSYNISCIENQQNGHFVDMGELCETISLADMIEALNIKHIDYLKMDCEGSEYEILENFRDFDKISIIAMEVHTFFGQKRKENLLKMLSEYYYFTDINKRGIFTAAEAIKNSSQDLSNYYNISNILLFNKRMR